MKLKFKQTQSIIEFADENLGYRIKYAKEIAEKIKAQIGDLKFVDNKDAGFSILSKFGYLAKIVVKFEVDTNKKILCTLQSIDWSGNVDETEENINCADADGKRLNDLEDALTRVLSGIGNKIDTLRSLDIEATKQNNSYEDIKDSAILTEQVLLEANLFKGLFDKVQKAFAVNAAKSQDKFDVKTGFSNVYEIIHATIVETFDDLDVEGSLTGDTANIILKPKDTTANYLVQVAYTTTIDLTDANKLRKVFFKSVSTPFAKNIGNTSNVSLSSALTQIGAALQLDFSNVTSEQKTNNTEAEKKEVKTADVAKTNKEKKVKKFINKEFNDISSDLDAFVAKANSNLTDEDKTALRQLLNKINKK